MSDKKKIGVITEQGFVMGDNLGFKPIKEEKLDPSKKDKKEEDKKKKTEK